METKKKEQNTKAEAETFAATVKGMNRDDQLTQRPRPPNSTTTLCERKSTATSKAREPLLRHWPTR